MSRSLELYSYLSKFTLFNIYFFYNFLQSSEGNALLHYMGVATEQLSPPHNYVPWIVVDGVHNEQIGKHIIAVK